jgi:CyaY protein
MLPAGGLLTIISGLSGVLLREVKWPLAAAAMQDQQEQHQRQGGKQLHGIPERGANGNTVMNENDFNDAADKQLDAIVAAFDASGLDCEPELKAGGVLEIEFANGSRMIVNRHSIAREIWVAAKSGGFHFRLDNGRWVDTRSGEELFVALSRLAGEQSGEVVRLGSGPAG